jgi:Rrf2 family protein
MPIINRDTDYAVRALARLGATGSVTAVSELAEAERVPVDFLRKIMQRLQRAGLLESRQGPSGGYRLVRSPAETPLLDVIEAVQGPIVMNLCFGEGEACPNARGWGLRKRLRTLQSSLKSWLAETTLADVMQRAPQRKGAAR